MFSKMKSWMSYGLVGLGGAGILVAKPTALVVGLLKALGVFTAGGGVFTSAVWFLGVSIATYLGIFILSIILAFISAWVSIDTYKSVAEFTLDLYKDDKSVNKSKAYKKVEEYLNKLEQGEK